MLLWPPIRPSPAWTGPCTRCRVADEQQLPPPASRPRTRRRPSGRPHRRGLPLSPFAASSGRRRGGRGYTGRDGPPSCSPSFSGLLAAVRLTTDLAYRSRTFASEPAHVSHGGPFKANFGSRGSHRSRPRTCRLVPLSPNRHVNRDDRQTLRDRAPAG